MPIPVRDLFTLEGQHVLVTGGGRGLGARIARAASEMGASVSIASRKREICEATAAEIAKSTGQRTAAFGVDVADEASVATLFQAAEAALGPIHGLVNDAGATWGAAAEDMPVAAWDKVMGVNARGTFLCAREAARRWIARDAPGTILNLASVAGVKGQPPEFLDAVGYSASKGAVVALTRDLAAKWARRGIRVNALAPGWFPTDMSKGVLAFSGERMLDVIPMGRFGGEDEIEGAAVFLLSRASAYMTGQVVSVDGGLTAI